MNMSRQTSSIFSELMRALGKRAQNDSSDNLVEKLHDMTLDYVMGGLSIKTICSLLKQFNDTLVALQLPPEIMFKVFIAVRKQCDLTEDRYSWLSLTRVCRRWRALAFDCKELWTTLVLDYMPLDVAALFIKQSSPLSLEVKLHSRHFSEKFQKADFIRLFQTYQHRLRFIHLYAQHFSHDELAPLFNTQSPMSEHLSISDDSFDGLTGQPEVYGPYPDFSGVTSQVQYLALRGRFRWIKGIFSNLTTLICFRQDFGDADFLSCLWKTLIASPHLEILSLSGGAGRDPVMQFNERPRVFRRNLRQIALSATIPPSIIRKLLRLIEVPSAGDFVYRGRNSDAAIVGPFTSHLESLEPEATIAIFAHSHETHTVVIQQPHSVHACSGLRAWIRARTRATVVLLRSSRLSTVRNMRFYSEQLFFHATQRDWFLSAVSSLDQLETIYMFNHNPIGLLSTLLSASQQDALQSLKIQLREEIAEPHCKEHDSNIQHFHTFRVFGVSLGGRPARARVICGCRPTCNSDQNRMFVLTAVMKGIDTPRTFDEALLLKSMHTQKDLFPEMGWLEEIRDMLNL